MAITRSAPCTNCGHFDGRHAPWCKENASTVAVPMVAISEGEQHEETLQHPLFEVFLDAIEQAMHGKGERHGGARTPFLEQPWNHYAKLHGRGFLTGQAAKKLEEAASTREGKEFETEVFGAMVYLGMAILHERSK